MLWPGTGRGGVIKDKFQNQLFARYPNALLSAFAPDDLARLEAQLEPVELNAREVLDHAGDTIRYLVFPFSGLLSVMAKAKLRQIEVGTIGRDGVTGTSVILGVDEAPHRCFVEVSGSGVRISVEDFKAAVVDRPALMKPVLGFVHAYIMQLAETSLANGCCTLEERLARWLLASQDRLGSDQMPLTHEFLAMMLGVRRPGVTVALQSLEGKQAIRNVRCMITIRDRSRLENLAGGAYRAPGAIK